MSQEMLDKGIMKIGVTEAILPPAKQKDGYFTTGTVSNTGGNYKMSMELIILGSGP